MSDGSEALDCATLRQDVVQAVARLCPNWLADRRDDLVQAAVIRVMQIVNNPPVQVLGALQALGRPNCLGTADPHGQSCQS